MRKFFTSLSRKYKTHDKRQSSGSLHCALLYIELCKGTITFWGGWNPSSSDLLEQLAVCCQCWFYGTHMSFNHWFPLNATQLWRLLEAKLELSLLRLRTCRNSSVTVKEMFVYTIINKHNTQCTALWTACGSESHGVRVVSVLLTQRCTNCQKTPM